MTNINTGKKVRYKIVQTQSTGVVVKEKQHHQRHKVHDEFHVGHTGLLGCLLLSHGHHGVKMATDGNREKTDVVVKRMLKATVTRS